MAQIAQVEVGSRMVEQIKPWVDLITWQVVALLGGIALLPAVYDLLKRVRSPKLAGGEAVIDPEEVKKIENDASSRAEAETPAQAAEQVEKLQDEQPGTAERRLEKILQAWARIQKLARDKARRFGGQDSRAVIPNLTILAKQFPDSFSLEDVAWAQELRDQLKGYQGNLSELTASAYRGFAISAGRLAKRIQLIPDG
jgi:hypothetical protein